MQIIDFKQQMAAQLAEAEAWLNERNEIIANLEEAKKAVAELTELAAKYDVAQVAQVQDYIAQLSDLLGYHKVEAVQEPMVNLGTVQVPDPLAETTATATTAAPVMPRPRPSVTFNPFKK